MSTDGQNKIYAMVTDAILAAMENGTVPWRKPWSTAGNGLPLRMSNGKAYRGINVWLLSAMAMGNGYDSPYWGTYDNIAKASGMVKKGNRWISPDGTPRGIRAGEKSTVVVFWKRIIVKDDKSPDGTKAIFMLRYYRVFNASQADGLPAKYYPAKREAVSEPEAIESAESIVSTYAANGGPSVAYSAQGQAFYTAANDAITLPERSQFKTAGGMYHTLFHEFGHSTGHESRLAREGVTGFDHFGSGRYAAEELIAEMTGAFLAADAGIDSEIENNAAYIKSWMRELTNDPKLVVKAAQKAQKAADHIRGITFTESESE